MSNRKSFESSLVCQGCRVERWTREVDEWQSEHLEIRSLKDATCTTPYPSIFFAKAGAIRQCHRCRDKFSELFKLPNFFWADYCKRSNGYFGCENTYGNSGLESHNTWFRFYIKKVLQYNLPNGKDYVWHKVNVFTMWLPGGENAIVSFETPDFLKPKILDFLAKTKLPSSNPYWVHSAFLEEVVGLQDQAVWCVRDVVRSTELNRTSSARPNPQYPRLHDIARHAIHVAETLDVAIVTIEDMIMQHDHFFLERSVVASDHAPQQTRKRLYFYLHMMKSLKSRAQANKERLLNEITLAFNTVAQYDSRISVQIGQAAQSDSAAMKTIAFLTLAFLPATFISAIFSMSFFNFTPGQDGAPDKWSISEEFWLYWAVAVPLSAATVTLWLFWHRFFPPKIIGE